MNKFEKVKIGDVLYPHSIEMSDEEVEAMNAENESVKTPEERIAELEAMLNALISGRTEP